MYLTMSRVLYDEAHVDNGHARSPLDVFHSSQPGGASLPFKFFSNVLSSTTSTTLTFHFPVLKTITPSRWKLSRSSGFWLLIAANLDSDDSASELPMLSATYTPPLLISRAASDFVPVMPACHRIRVNGAPATSDLGRMVRSPCSWLCDVRLGFRIAWCCSRVSVATS